MENFCKYCGKPMENDMCDCEGFWKENAEQAVKAAPEEQTAEQQQAPIQQQAPVQPKAPSAAQEKVKQILDGCKTLVVNVLKNPQEAIVVGEANPDKIPAFVLGGLHLLLLFIFTWIHIPALGEYIGAAGRAKIGFVLLLAAAIGILSVTLFAFLFGKKNVPGQTFVRVLANFCIATLPGTCFFILSFVFGLFSFQIALALLLLCFVAWMLYSQETIRVCMNNSPIAYWVNLLAVLVGGIVIAIISKAILKNVMTSFLNNLLGGFGSFLW